MPVTTHHQRSSWTTFTQSIAKLAQAPGQVLTHGLHQVSKLPAVTRMKTRAAAQELGHQWQAAARSTTAPTATSRPSSPSPRSTPAAVSASRAQSKAQFFAEHREELRSQKFWARQDKSGQWQLAPHESNLLHHASQAGEGFLQRIGEKAYDLVTLPAQLGAFAASPAGEVFRTQPETVAAQVTGQLKQQAQRLAFDVPSGKVQADAERAFREGTARERGAMVGGAVFEVASWMPLPLAKAGQSAKNLLTAARDLITVGEAGKLTQAGGRAIDGLRAPAAQVLDAETIQYLRTEFESMGGDVSRLRFNEGKRTGYVDDKDTINVRGDVLPNPYSTHPRSSMSPRAVLAHERGHQVHRGTSLPQGAWNDEFRASYWAATNCPNLSDEERCHLVMDAIERARESGVPIRYNKFMRSVLYGEAAE